MEQPNSKTRRGRVGHQIANTLTTSCNQGVVIDMNDGFVNRKYEEFYSKNGYIPNMFNPYNCNEIDDYSPTMTTQCGSTTSSSTVLIKEDNMNELMQVGQLEGRHEQSNRIYSEEGICPTIMAGERKSCTGGYVSPKIMVKEKDMNELIRVGQVSNKGSQAGMVYDSEGLFPTICACTHGYAIGNILDYKLNYKGVNNMWNNNLGKLNFKMEEIRIFDIFAGIGALHQSLKELGIPVRVTNLSEVDIDATISYAGGHIDNFKDLEFEYPSVEEMRQWLIDRNIGYSFEKNKSSVPRMKVEKLKLAYKANVLLNNLGDISKIDYDKIEDFDLMNMSFPCTDLSNAGQQRGMRNEDGTPTRSGLYVYSIKAVRAKKPKYVMIENVKALIQKKFIEDFYSVINELEECGYNCYYPTKQDKKGNTSPVCLNSKDFGIPQNRERIFVIAIRKDIDTQTFEFPIGKDQGVRLKDVLQDQVNEKYYLSDEIQQRFKLNGKSDDDRNDINTIGTSAPKCRTIGQRDITYGVNGIMSTLTATDYKQPKQILNVQNGAIRGRYNEDGKIEQQLELRTDGVTNTLTTVEKDNVIIEDTSYVNRIGGCFDTEKTTHQAGSVYDNEYLSPTLDTMQGGYRQPCIKVIGKLECEGWHDIETRVHDCGGISPTIETKNRGKYMDGNNFKIRKLTPLECWRLMGFRDEAFYKAQELGISDSQLYKQAGNSIVVNCLYYIFKNLFIRNGRNACIQCWIWYYTCLW